MSERVVHWLPQPLNEGCLTACGLDVYAHRFLQFRTSQNEADCKRCLSVRSFPDNDLEDAPPVLGKMQGG